MKTTLSIWRYSHLTMAISSSLFIIIASITGIILAFEPISNQLKPYAIHNSANITLATTISSLKNEYDEVITLKVDDHNFIEASVFTKEGKSDTFYINPTTGKKIASLEDRNPIFSWTTNFHRSLFLKSTGRFLVGFFSFLLFLIAVTGSILVIKRQGGITKFFTKVIKEDINQYYHVLLGRYTLIPIVIITLTGVFLSLGKFSLLPENKISHNFNLPETKTNKNISIADFSIFKNTKLNELTSLEFPFSDDEEDFFFLKLKNKEMYIHQYTGDIISSQNFSWTQILTHYSLILHTGKGTILWSVILMFSSFSILFFVYSGFAITINRRQKNSLLKNKYNKNAAEYILLVGSETGSTFSFANSLFNALLKAKKTVFIDSLNNYSNYGNAKHLVVLTSTYGDGTAPANANNFLTTLKNTQQSNSIEYSVIGFGSLAYTNYCKFATDVDLALHKLFSFKRALPIYKINNQSFTDFKQWGILWGKKNGIELELKQKLQKQTKQQLFTVVEKTQLNTDDSFLIKLKPHKQTKFLSGDLLAITPKEDNLPRLYSIGKIDNCILLSIKKYSHGICSSYLNQLEINSTVLATIQANTSFHFPKKSKEVVLIANGTGIAPFLGMIHEKDTAVKTHLFWGGRTKASAEMYSKHLLKASENKQLTSLYIAYSQEQKEKMYVQDLLVKQENIIASALKNKGTIMICGSVAMMNDVIKVLEKISLEKLKKPLNFTQIKTDCY
ncbi:PepSY domain-containing protein [Tenacibaculum sp. IB213877]|uniref:PepSY domain-containing protein n=1 Tax=Tenacibaculum sp. IB213877 TaxID=3097351 RepID=UPI002A5A6D9C|nr:PepSY domain-containing protein [Tenacibaculum sp. IB213877]MDY0779376.1 PepSY domain-containing protein [Tenacibaculum sp. IB213877]